jgi:class 3 adenylate cyclase/YHS domain-containing protein
MHDAGDGRKPYVFLFADLAGFTALTEAHGDEQAADVVGEFARRAGRLLPAHRAEQVKTIGDALLLRVAEPAPAIALGLALTSDLLADHGYPAVRVGMHYGPAVCRDGDWIGGTVNLAARVCGLAAGGEVLLSRATRDGAGPIRGVGFEDRGDHPIRNLSQPVRLFAALREAAPARAMVVDPVCRMVIAPARAAAVLIHDDVKYHFCSPLCAGRFAAAPADYVREAETET